MFLDPRITGTSEVLVEGFEADIENDRMNQKGAINRGD
jgi:hypothetical protein